MRHLQFAAAATCALALSWAASAPAQTSASGQAFGARIDAGGTNQVDQSDTGPRSASGTGSFDRSASGSNQGAAPLFEVVTGASRTRGCADPDGCPELFSAPSPPPSNLQSTQFALSEAGDATVSIGPGQVAPGTDLLDAVSSGAQAQVVCPAGAPPSASGTSHVDGLVIAGTSVPVPGSQPPNTTVVSPQASLIVLNEQRCPDPSAPAGTLTCTVNALHVQMANPSGGGVMDMKLSGTTASASGPNCTNGCGPNLGNSIKTSQVLQADRTTPKNPQTPSPGDPIRFTIAATNSATATDACTADQQTGHHLEIIDRIPLGVTVDPSSITVQTDDGTPVPTPGTIANCSADLQFVGCEPEPPSDPSRQCLTIEAGDLASGQTKKVSFIATVDSSATGGSQPGCDQSGTGAGICNTALIVVDEIENPSATPRTSTIQCPNPTNSSGQPLVTTGSGGCSLRSRGGATRSETLPTLLLVAGLAVRRWRRRERTSARSLRTRLRRLAR